MAAISAATQRSSPSTRRVSRAACARSEKAEFTGWALSRHAAVRRRVRSKTARKPRLSTAGAGPKRTWPFCSEGGERTFAAVRAKACYAGHNRLLLQAHQRQLCALFDKQPVGGKLYIRIQRVPSFSLDFVACHFLAMLSPIEIPLEKQLP